MYESLERRRARSAIIRVATILAIVPTACAPDFAQRSGPLPSSAELPLVGRPDPVDVDAAATGMETYGELKIANVSNRVTHLSRITSSCPCVRVCDAPQVIQPGEAVRVRVMFDASEEPSFHGKLLVDIFGEDPGGARVLAAQVSVRIPAGDEAGGRVSSGNGTREAEVSSRNVRGGDQPANVPPSGM
jgi:hypothetical protein